MALAAGRREGQKRGRGREIEVNERVTRKLGECREKEKRSNTLAILIARLHPY